MDRICYIAGAGENYGLDMEPGLNDFVIAADAGFKYLTEAGIKVDMVVGDFDTLGYAPDHENILKLKPEKDITDTYAAIEEGLKRGYSTFHLYGCLGGRLDHTLGNLQILASMAAKGIECWLHGDGICVTAISDRDIKFASMEKGMVSIFAHGGKAEGVTIKGLKYQLDGGELNDKFPLGVSNEFIGKEAVIEVKKGTLIIMVPKEASQSVCKLPVDEEILAKLMEMEDLKYKAFHSKLMPTVDRDKVIGVRTPQLRKLAKELMKRADGMTYLDMLPHKYYEEDNLHGFMIEEIKDYDLCLKKVDQFLPYIDNWATCDSMTPKALKKEPAHFAQVLAEWLKSDQVYRVRYAVKMLMAFYLDEEFDEKYLALVSEVDLDEYYVKMAVAWYFATALAKQYEAALPYIEEGKLDTWTHNKTIQKAIESCRITPDQKKYLRSLKKEDMKIVKWNKIYAQDFIDISMEWLVKYDLLEDIDLEILNHPYENILDDGGMIYFALVKGQAVGTVSMMKVSEGVWEVVKLGVRGEYQGRGIGRMLMEKAMEFAREKKAEKVILFTNSRLESAIKLYEKFGFKDVPLADNEYEEADKKMEAYL